MDLIQTIRTSAVGLEPRQRVGRGVPDPIDPRLNPAVQQYITALRELYDVSGLTYGEIHSTHGFQPSFTSRSLGGKRVSGTPNDRRLRTMLVEAWARRCAVSSATRRGVDVEVAILHHEAVRACSEVAYRRMITEEDLAAAVHEREAAWEHVQELTRRLEQQQALQQNLEERIRELTSQGTETQELGRRRRRLVDDRQRLLEQILTLSLTLRRAQDAQAQAEARCITLESELLRIKARDTKPVNGAEFEQRHIDGRAASEARQEQLSVEIRTIIDENDRLEGLIKEVNLDTERPLTAGELRERRVHRAMYLLGMAESDHLTDHPEIMVKLNEILQLLGLPPITGRPHDDWLSSFGQGI
ncbi:hypothetical protein [Streptomyces tendae]|uniref:hypothetical protein n=1 Tax=Streptomyces tendae TaxID=1932 RepID=UPI002491D699|nr:hypothetical protein [Streptomyces tendae]